MSMPSCYGQVWEGVPGSLCVDQGCGVLDDCLVKFASGVLVDWQRSLGEKVTAEQLSQATSVRVEAILKALEFQQTAGIVPFIPPTVVAADPANLGTEQTVAVEIPPPSEVIPAEGTQEAARVLSPAEVEELYNGGEPMAQEGAASVPFVESRLADVVQLPGTAEAAGALKEVSEMAPRKKKGRGKSAPKGKMPKGAVEKTEAAPAVVSRPQSAGPAKSARVPAKERRAYARPAAAQEGSRKTRQRSEPAQHRQWDGRYNKSRWERERERSPLIAQLRPGMKLRRIWEGQTLEVVVVKGGYRFQGVVYPTLYSVVQQIVGTVPRKKQRRADGTMPDGTRDLTNWSGPRFFRLPWIIGGQVGAT